MFSWKRIGEDEKFGYALWSSFKENTDYFNPSSKEFMVNFRVENLQLLLKEGVHVIDKIEEYDCRKIWRIMDP